MSQKTLSVTYGLNINATASSDSQNLGLVSETINLSPRLRFDTGTGQNQADVLYQAGLVITGNVTLDLLALPTGLGVVALDKVKLISMTNLDATQSLSIGGAFVDPWTACIYSDYLLPGGQIFKSAPGACWPVDATHHNLLLNAGSASIEIEIIILGCEPMEALASVAGFARLTGTGSV